MSHQRKHPFSLLEILVVICLLGMVSGVMGHAANHLWKEYRCRAERAKLCSLIENVHSLAAWTELEIQSSIRQEKNGFILFFNKWDGLYQDRLGLFRKEGHLFAYISYDEGLQELKKSGYDTKL